METEEQQVEELKHWWKENGRTVIAGLVLGLGGVFGFTTWQGHQASRAELASELYTRLVETAAGDTHDQALLQAERIIEEYPGSGYSSLAALVAARSAYASGQPEAARQHLEWVRDNAPEPEFATIARLRLARLLLEDGKYDGALAELQAVSGPSFTTLAAEARGDVMVARGDKDAALTAYREALADPELDTSSRSRIEVKLNDLGSMNVK